jgi:hypothetical protein
VVLPVFGHSKLTTSSPGVRTVLLHGQIFKFFVDHVIIKKVGTNSPDNSFKEFLLNPLSALPELRVRTMFGGFRQD